MDDTVSLYRDAVDYFIAVMLEEWNLFSNIGLPNGAVTIAERLCNRTEKNPCPKYDFPERFYKFPCYLRRAAINTAYGFVSSYRSNLANWEKSDRKNRGKCPSFPKAGYVCPAMYRDKCFVRTGTYTARIKVWTRNTWDWADVSLRKTDVDYILRRCAGRKECVPTLRRRGKVWSLDFAFEEKVKLPEMNNTNKTRIVAVDLGINSACTCSVMGPDGAVVGRRFLHLPSEYDRLDHAVGRIKHAQQSGARRFPHLWAVADGINRDIAVKTAQFIADTAMMYGADVVVMEALDLSGRKRGSKRQRLALWRAAYVQSMVMTKAHRAGIRVSRVFARNTSRLAFDGSGRVLRGRESEKTCGSYSLCEFATGKVYNCDLNASYNIGARYYIREILRIQSERTRLALTAQVPSLARRSTCTLSDLKGLRAALAA